MDVYWRNGRCQAAADRWSDADLRCRLRRRHRSARSIRALPPLRLGDAMADLSLFAYVATVFVVGVSWLTVARNLVLPHVSLSGDYLMSSSRYSAQR